MAINADKKCLYFISDVFCSGWLYKVKLDKPSELKKLMDEDDYQEYLKTQAHD